MEKWEYLERHKDLYKNIVMMEDQPGCSSIWDPQDDFCSPPNSPYLPVGDDYSYLYVNPNIEETNLSGDQQFMGEDKTIGTVEVEESSLDVKPDGSSNRNPPERCPQPLDSTLEDHTIPQHDTEEEEINMKIDLKEEVEENRLIRDQPSTRDSNGSSTSNPPQRCPHPLDFQKSTQKCGSIPHNDKETVLKNLKVEEEGDMYGSGDQQHMEDSGMSFSTKEEEYFIGIDTDRSSNRNQPERCPRPQDSTQEDHTIPQHDTEEVELNMKIGLKEEEEEKRVIKDQPSTRKSNGSSTRNPQRRCPRPLDSRKSTKKGGSIPHNDKNTVLKNLKAKEKVNMYGSGDQQHMEYSEMSFSTKEEEYFIGIDTDRYRNQPERCPRPQDSTPEGHTIPLHGQGGISWDCNVKREFKKEEDDYSMQEYLNGQTHMMKSPYNRNPPKKCPFPLDSQDNTKENHTIRHHDQDTVLKNIKVEEEGDMYESNDQQHMEHSGMSFNTKEEESCDSNNTASLVDNALSSRTPVSVQVVLEEFSDSDSDLDSLMESIDSDNAPEDLSSDYEIESEGDSDSSEISDAQTWCSINTRQSQPKPSRFSFSGIPGLKVQCEHNPLAYLELFLNDAVIQKIVEETNRYAAEQLTSPLAFSRTRNWEPVTQKEFWLFLALTILQGLVAKPLQKWYWTAYKLLATPFFGTVMSEYRFGLIMKFLHFTNNDDFDKTTHPAPELKQIWEVYQMIINNFRSCYVPERDVTMDESLMAHKEKLSWLQYVESKRARYGFRSFMLCESNSGYIWNSVIYTGKGTQFDPKFNSYGVATSAVLSLMEPLLNQGYCLTTNIYYTSHELYEFLIKNKTDCYGPVRAHRHNLPSNFRTQKLKPGEMVAWKKGKMMALRWHDQKDVCMMSTVHSTKSAKNLQKPQVVVDYNRTIGVIDKAGQAMIFYPAVRNQQKKYYKKIFRHLVEQCLWNAYVLFKKHNDRSILHHDFIWQICDAICTKHQTAEEQQQRLKKQHQHHYLYRHIYRPIGQLGLYASPLRLSARHFPEYIPQRPTNKAPTKRCVVCCSKRGEDGRKIRRETRTFCPDCNVGLCAVSCFKTYHTKDTF